MVPVQSPIQQIAPSPVIPGRMAAVRALAGNVFNVGANIFQAATNVTMLGQKISVVII
jgi:hypothetical protein